MARTGKPMSIEALEASLLEKVRTGTVPGLSVSVVEGDRVD